MSTLFGAKRYAFAAVKISTSLESVMCIASVDVPDARPVKAELIAAMHRH